MPHSLWHRWLVHAGACTASVVIAGPLQAAVVCTGPGYPPGCVAVEAAPAGPVVGPNAGGPVNRVGYR